MTELKTAIEKFHNSAVGPDEVRYSFLKQIPSKSLELLLEIYKNIWTGKQFPKSWKQATVIPIPKPGKILHTVKTIVQLHSPAAYAKP